MTKKLLPHRNFLANRMIRVFAYSIAFLFIPIITFAQTQISGTVKDNEGNPMINVSVVVKGSLKGVTTDASGNFSISARPNDVIVFSYTGYETKEVRLGNQSVLNISLDAKANSLSEVVVVGYGKEKRENLTGAIVSASGKELSKSPTISLTNSLAGLLPGVVTQNFSGEPGRDNASILIRGRNTTGNNNPLVVVDGIQNASGWQYINSNDIESISVLKDASAAIYGAQAANGVILITTKRGTLGKPTISYILKIPLEQKI